MAIRIRIVINSLPNTAPKRPILPARSSSGIIWVMSVIIEVRSPEAPRPVMQRPAMRAFTFGAAPATEYSVVSEAIWPG